MQFKHPEILYFLFLLVIPIIVHLFQLRRFKKEYFTNVKLLRELSIIQTRKSSKIKKWLLLATRLALLTALILAFAQPFFKAKDSQAVTNELYIVLDNSFSMQAKGQQGELLKRAVQDLLEKTPENLTFSLLTIDAVYWNTDIKSIQKELMNLNYSATPFQLDQALSTIKSKKSPFNKDIIIMTDAINLSASNSNPLDEVFNPFVLISKAEQKNNIAIDSVYLNQTLANFYEIGVKLKSFSKATPDVAIALYNQKQLIAKTQATLTKKEQELFFTIPKEDFNGYVYLEEQAGLTYDNYYYFSISKPKKTTVLAIGEPEKNQFLAKLYPDDEFQLITTELKTLDYNLIENQSVVILNELDEIPQALQTTLKSFYEKGGNLIFIPSANANTTNYNAFLINFGTFSFGNSNKREQKITSISFTHPLYNGVFEKKVTNFQYPTTQLSYDLRSTTSAILSFDDQRAFLTSATNSLSSFYIFTAPISKSFSNFQNSPLIVPTFYNMAQQNTNTGISAFAIGTSTPIILDETLSKDEIVEVIRTGENGEKFIPQQQVLSKKVRLSFVENPQEAGNYTALKANMPIKNISFNYPRTESDLSLDNSNLLAAYPNEQSLDSVFNTLQTNRTDNQLWKWFVALTLLFLILEILIQKFVK